MKFFSNGYLGDVDSSLGSDVFVKVDVLGALVVDALDINFDFDALDLDDFDFDELVVDALTMVDVFVTVDAFSMVDVFVKVDVSIKVNVFVTVDVSIKVDAFSMVDVFVKVDAFVKVNVLATVDAFELLLSGSLITSMSSKNVGDIWLNLWLTVVLK